MAHPWYHALMAAKRFGGVPDDYLALESWMDYTKSHIADCRHRLFLHNSWGIFVGERVLGTTLTRASDGKIVPTRPLFEQHILEDFGMIPTLVRCLAQMRPLSTANHTSIEQHCQHDAATYGGTADDYRALHRFLDWPRDFLTDGRYQRILHNGWGVALTVEAFGDTCLRASDGVCVDVRQIVTGHIERECGSVPTIETCLEGLSVQPWMCNRAMRGEDAEAHFAAGPDAEGGDYASVVR